MLTICVGMGKVGSETRHDEVVIHGIACPVCTAIDMRLDAEHKLAEANRMLERSDRMMDEKDAEIRMLRSRIGVLEAPEAVAVA